MVSKGPCLHVACGVMLFVYVVSCMHGRFDPVLMVFQVDALSFSQRLKVQSNFIPGVYKKLYITKFVVSKLI